MTGRIYSNAFLALFPAVYLAHLADERFFGMGTASFATEYLDMPFSNNKELRAIGAQVLTELSADEYPYMLEHVQFHMDGRDKRNDFKYMLDLILEGLARDHADG